MKQADIRKIKSSDYEHLAEFLRLSMWVDEERPRPPIEEVEGDDELNVYFKNFGQIDDRGLVAEIDNKIIGVAWSRLNLFAKEYLGAKVPDIVVSVLDNYRNRGIGTMLLEALLCELRKSGFEKAALFANKKCPSVSLYKKLGFHVATEFDHTEYEDCLMAIKL